MKKVLSLLVVLLVAATGSALAAEFTVHGDLNNRFNLYTNQAGVYGGAETISKTPVSSDDVEEFFADLKYRMNVTAATNDGAVKGVMALEVGGLQFGSDVDYSGDELRFEVRKAYVDFQLPGVMSKARLSTGLQALTVNPFVWWETVPSVQLMGDAGSVAYKLAWARGIEAYNTSNDDDLFEDADALLARGDFAIGEGAKAGVVLLYQRKANLGAAADSAVSYQIKRFGVADYDIYTLGTDGKLTAGDLFANWDLFYQGGSIDNNVSQDLDVSAFLVHADLGINLGPTRVTYTGIYTSGDDDSSDNDVENFMSTDVDRTDSIVLQEGGYTDDDYFTEAPHILSSGLILNKLAVDHKLSDKTKLGGALLYLMTAEDLANGEDTLGTEIDAYVSHMLYPELELAFNAGYLFTDDGMDNFAAGGDADDIFRITSRIRYKF
jgi:hypothetical protein